MAGQYEQIVDEKKKDVTQGPGALLALTLPRKGNRKKEKHENRGFLQLYMY